MTTISIFEQQKAQEREACQLLWEQAHAADQALAVAMRDGTEVEEVKRLAADASNKHAAHDLLSKAWYKKFVARK